MRTRFSEKAKARVMLDSDEFVTLVKGGIVDKDGIEIALKDIGYGSMQEYLSRAQFEENDYDTVLDRIFFRIGHENLSISNGLKTDKTAILAAMSDFIKRRSGSLIDVNLAGCQSEDLIELIKLLDSMNIRFTRITSGDIKEISKL